MKSFPLLWMAFLLYGGLGFAKSNFFCLRFGANLETVVYAAAH